MLCFGGNVFGWTVDEATSFRLLDVMVAEGMNFVDTADVYSVWAEGNQGGESEAIIGNWLARRRKRHDIILATKVGWPTASGEKGLSKAYIRKSIEQSLRRLQTDYVDLYQSHRDDENVAIEETLEAYDALIREGKVRVIGASNFPAARVRASLDVSVRNGYPRYESIQPRYNLFERQIYEGELEALCREQGIGVICHTSLAQGFLTGKYRSEQDLGTKARSEAIRKYMNTRGFSILSRLDEVAKEHAATPAQVALAWLIARPGTTAPIVSATSVPQLHELVAAARLELSPSCLTRLNATGDGLFNAV